MAHTGDVYDTIARRYAAVVDTKPFNAHYERPAVFSMLPPLAGLTVLDAACGPGWYSERLLEKGASVTAIDLNAEFVEMARSRLGTRAEVFRADLTQPLPLEAGRFDLVLCTLALHYIEDWVPPLREFHRVLNEDGSLVFSIHHPFMAWKLFDRPDYFATEVVEDDWPDIGRLRFYRHSLTTVFDALAAASFCVERLLEPRPTEAFRDVDPVNYEKLMTNPWFLVIRAKKNQNRGQSPL
jgi:SAM-dependent methyltransferase